jgi:hypothetical protein
VAEATASVIGAASGFLLLVAFLAGSFALVVTFFPSAAGGARPAATLVVFLWLLVAGFHLLGWAHVFRLEAALLVCPAAWWLWHRDARRMRAALLEQRDGARRLAAEFRGPLAKSFLAAGAAVLLARLLRGLVAPPLGWDALTYHLVKPANWIRAAGFRPEEMPDLGGAYEFFPYAGDVLWAWAMLPFRGDGGLAVAGILVVIGCAAAVFTLARELGGGRPESLLAGLAFAFLPPCVNVATNAYVDNTAALCSTLGLVFLCRLLRGSDAREGILAAAALGCGAGAKVVVIPILAIGALVAARSVLRAGARGPWLRLGAGILGAGAVALPGYVRAWLERGSPLYPLPLVVAGRTLAKGHEGLTLALAGQLEPLRQSFDLPAFLEALFIPDSRVQFLNPGPGGLVLAVLGLCAAVRLCLRSPREAARAALLLATAGVVVLGVSGPDTFALRTHWVGMLGRFLLPSLACVAAFAATLDARSARPLLAAVLAANLWLAVPRGWSEADVAAILRLCAVLAAGAAAAVLLVRLGRSRPRLSAALALGVACASVSSWGSLRASARYPIYRAASVQRAYDAHTLHADYMTSWPLWALFDAGTPHRLAVSAGWNGIGDNWYRYPFFGSRFQNEVVYVPPTAGGSVLDYRTEGDLRARASRRAWLQRLAAARVDAVVLLPPLPPLESRWASELPQVFVPVAEGSSGLSRAFRFDAAAAARMIGAPGDEKRPGVSAGPR